MNSEKYQSFSTEDFLDDEDFRQWVLRPDTDADAFWNRFLAAHPEKQQIVTEARQMLKDLFGHFEKQIKQVPKKQAQASFNKVARELGKPARLIRMRRRRWIGWAAVAASIVLIIGFFGQDIFHRNHAAKMFTTKNGERLTFMLPDSSQVDLNANSTLVYFPDKWNQLDAREVWLEGEAFFTVKKTAERTKFFVHADQMNIEVLGTQFNVRNREGRSEVVLAEGKVELDVAEQKIEMTPGDLVRFTKTDGKVETKKVKPADYSAWKDGFAVFNSSLDDVVKELETLYGVPFSIENEALKKRHIQLSAPADSLEQVLEILKLLYPDEITVKKENDRVVISQN
ncbi:MAG: FecR domain-containing protein [Bacteroidota bacterium]